jgi:DNA-directed RNA polymerase sigma subunit (sigma70/sigma32)
MPVKEEQEKLCADLVDCLSKYERLIFSIPEVTEYLFHDWKEKKSINPLGISKYGIDYNSSVKGLNVKIRNRVNKAFVAAEKGKGSVRVESLVKAEIHPKVLLNSDILGLLKISPNGDKALRLVAKISEIRSALVDSVHGLITVIAQTKIKRLNNNIIELCDLVQQGVIAAYECTLTYDVAEGTKWSLYAGLRVDKALEKFLIDKSRVVNLPKYIMERWSVVSKAIAKTGNRSIHNLVLVSNKILAEQKMQLLNRKLKVSEVFTEDEIEKLLLTIQNSYHVDHASDEFESSELLSEEEKITEEIDSSTTMHVLPKILEEILGKEDWDLLKIRWGFETGAECTVPQTIEIWEHKTGIQLQSAKVRAIENKAIEKIRDSNSKELLELWTSIRRN